MANTSNRFTPSKTGVLAMGALLTVFLFGLSAARSFLVPLCFSALLAFLMTRGVRFLRKNKVPESLALIIAAGVFTVPLAAIGYETVSQSEAVIAQFPVILQLLQRDWMLISNTAWGMRLGVADHFNLSFLASMLSSEADAKQGVDIALRGMRGFLSYGGEMILIAAFSFLMLASRERLKRFSEELLKRDVFRAVSGDPGQFIESIAELIQHFLVVRLLIMVSVAGIDWTVFKVCGMPFALLLAVFIGLMTLIPVFGFVFGVLPPIILAAAQGFSFLEIGYLFLTLGVVSLLESNVVSPKLLGHHLNLNLMVTFLGLFLGEELWGASGMFLSIPILGVFRIILTSAPAGVPWSQLMAEKEEFADRGLLTDSEQDTHLRVSADSSTSH